MAKQINIRPDIPSEDDALGFNKYVETLGGMIRDPDFQTPFCIGIYGKWGSGKTSFMQLLEKKVAQTALVEEIGWIGRERSKAEAFFHLLQHRPAVARHRDG